MRTTSILALAILSSCGGAAPPAEPPHPAVAAIDGVAVWDGPFTAADDGPARAWARVEHLLADRVSPPAGGPDAAWMRATWTTWLRAHVSELDGTGEALALIAETGGPREQVFAAASYATMLEALVTELRELPPPREIQDDAETVALYREEIGRTFAPLAGDARDAYLACADAAPHAPASMQAWAARCEEHAHALEAIAGPPPPAEPEPVAIPAECLGGRHDDPEAPPPDATRPLELVVVYDGDRFSGAAREQLIAAVQRQIGSDRPAPAFVPRADVRRAEALVAQRRWTARGPVCGQPPPLLALLAERHPNLAAATVRTICVGEEEVVCWLEVAFHHAGTEDATGLPDYRTVDIEGDPAAIASWTRAAAHLGPPTSARDGASLFASLAQRFFTTSATDDDDPWLRVSPTLSDASDALTACYGGPGIASFEIRWSISETGAGSDVVVTPITAPASDTERVQACVADALRALAWPCPRGGAPVAVHARVCMGRGPDLPSMLSRSSAEH